jgi:hypothetical protein
MSENQPSTGNKKTLLIVIGIFVALVAIMYFLMSGDTDVHIEAGH